MTTTFATVGIIAGALISLGVLLSPFYKKLKRWSAWFERFMRDWEGEEEAPGRAPVPGVMERLNKLDGELSNNGGSTTKDKVDQLYDNQAIFMKSVSQRLSAIENCLTVTPTNGSKQEKI